jgi:hypothetical protein
MSEESELHFELEVLTLDATNRPRAAGTIPQIIAGASEPV